MRRAIDMKHLKINVWQNDLLAEIKARGEKLERLKHAAYCRFTGETEDTELVRLYALHKHLGKHPPGAYIYGLGAKHLHAYHFDYVIYQVFSAEEIRNLRLSAPINVETVFFRGQNWSIKRVIDYEFLWTNGMLKKKRYSMITDRRFYDGIFTPADDSYGYTDTRGYGDDYGYGYGNDSIHHKSSAKLEYGTGCNDCRDRIDLGCGNCSGCCKRKYRACQSCGSKRIIPISMSCCLRRKGWVGAT